MHFHPDDTESLTLMYEIIATLMQYGIKEVDVKALAQLLGADQSTLDSMEDTKLSIDMDVIDEALAQKYLH